MNYTDQQKEFINVARNTISNDPFTRLSPKTREVLHKNNFIFDAHAHIFDGDCIDPKYFVIRALGAEDKKLFKGFIEFVVGRLLGDSSDKAFEVSFTIDVDDAIEKIYNGEIEIIETDIHSYFDSIEAQSQDKPNLKGMDALEGFDFKELKARIIDVISIIKTSSMENVYTWFHDKYAIQNVVEGKDLITIVLGMDIQPGWDESIIKSYKTQTDELAALSKKQAIIPFLPLHPKRATYLDEDYNFNELYHTFLEAFNQDNPTYFGVKLYPSLGYLPSDEALQPIFQICAEKGIPLVTHCGGEMISTFETAIKANRFGVTDTINEGSRKENARKLNNPNEWEAVLKLHSTEEYKLRLNFGHFGGDAAWKQDGHPNDWRVDYIIDLMNNKEYDVYADFSFNLNDKKVSKNFAFRLNHPDENDKIISKRCMFGTDFWVVVPMSDLIGDQRHFIELIGENKDALLRDNVLNFLGIQEFILNA